MACELRIGNILGLDWGYMGITEKKMETTKVNGLARFEACFMSLVRMGY